VIEAVVVVSARVLVPGPNAALLAGEDRAGDVVPVEGLFAPHVVIAIWGRGRANGFAKPGVLVGSVVGDQVDHDAQAAPLCLRDELVKVRERPVAGVDVAVVDDVVAVVAASAFEEGQ
jgi:hypothetical protein